MSDEMNIIKFQDRLAPTERKLKNNYIFVNYRPLQCIYEKMKRNRFQQTKAVMIKNRLAIS